MNAVQAAPAQDSRVLVVEDNDGLRRSLCYLLRTRGYRVEEAADGRLGLGKALEWLPDAAVLDLNLPGCDGYALARRIRQALGRRTVLIAWTGDAEQDESKALAAGFDQFLAKPAEFEKMDELLKEAASHRPRSTSRQHSTIGASAVTV